MGFHDSITFIKFQHSYELCPGRNCPVVGAKDLSRSFISDRGSFSPGESERENREIYFAPSDSFISLHFSNPLHFVSRPGSDDGRANRTAGDGRSRPGDASPLSRSAERLNAPAVVA